MHAYTFEYSKVGIGFKVCIEYFWPENGHIFLTLCIVLRHFFLELMLLAVLIYLYCEKMKSYSPNYVLKKYFSYWYQNSGSRYDFNRNQKEKKTFNQKPNAELKVVIVIWIKLSPYIVPSE